MPDDVGFALGDKPDWYDDAACMGLPTWVFYGEEEDQQEQGSHRPYLLPAEIEHAKTFCNEKCDVRAQCLEFALVHGENHGIWGGLTAAERRGLTRQRRFLAT